MQPRQELDLLAMVPEQQDQQHTGTVSFSSYIRCRDVSRALWLSVVLQNQAAVADGLHDVFRHVQCS